MKTLYGKFGAHSLAIAILMCLPGISTAELIIPKTPLVATQNNRPLTMIVAGKDHKLAYEAYNDASDIDGDGTLDVRFKPDITYYGLFDSNVCYTYNSNLFSPSEAAGAKNTCKNKWSGNFLNYLTTSRMDALRKVLYGGYREVDTATQTILRRAYIPHDAHSWGKEYKDLATDGYLISDYTPFAQPTSADRRHFFGNLTANKDQSCATLNDCSNMNPLLRIRRNVPGNTRIWQWASKERPVLHDTIATSTSQSASFPNGSGAQEDYTVRVLVCTSSFNATCKKYPNGNYKPTGLLHDYGENDSMYFGLLTGSYDKHMSGGRLRKVISSFKDEVDKDNGTFTTNAKIVQSFDRIRIRGFNQSSSTAEYLQSSPYTKSAKAPTEGEFVDWGNPVAEMMYEAVRYLSGKKSATSAFSATTTVDTAVGLSSVTWDDPYESTSAAKAPWCAKANLLTISDINTSYDSDSVTGSYFKTFSGDLSGLNVATLGDTITSTEDANSANINKIMGFHFIGQSKTLKDFAPTAKDVSSLGSIRGLAPEEPTKEGSYYSASVAYFAKTNNLRTATDKQSQIADTYVVALASPLPKIDAKLPNGKVIRLIPFSKTVAGSGVSNVKGDYQPTNQIVDFYVQTISIGDTAVNSGRYYAKFIINFEDVEQGGDHDMDAIAEYLVVANADNTLSVTVTPTYQAGGMQQHMGYVISGSTQDGVYLVARDESSSPAYFLNVPAGKTPGFCDATPVPASCGTLPTVGDVAPTFKFTPSSTTSGATLLRDPLWYAAKWGGFNDKNGNNKPDLDIEWDSNGDGVPDTYSLVQNPLKLKDSLKKSFDSILESSASSGNITSNGQEVNGGDRVFQPSFNSANWEGELVARETANLTNIIWTASQKIPLESKRNIFSWNESNSPNKGISFTWTALSGDQQSALGGTTDGENVLNYLRGNQTKEIQNGGAFRNRTKLLGDLAHSSPYYVKDIDTVFVGANDGMLHGFNGTTGVETIAYVPNLIFNNLKALSSPFYEHQYTVDGDIAVSSRSLTTGKNFLVASLGRGGKGLFGLNVTNPSTFVATDVLWELGGNADLGYVLGRPQIARLNNDVVAAVVGNGYNSDNGSAVLFIINLETGAIIRTIDTLATGDNGLATPALWDADNDGKADYVYAGDLKGNVWKFDLKDKDSTKWKLAFSDSTPTPLFVAKDAADNLQPITAQIYIGIDTINDDPNYGKRFIFFGTGRYMFQGDPTDKSLQTWYGIIDDDVVISSRNALKERAITTYGTVSGKLVRVFADAVTNDMAGKKGWYIDLVEGVPPSPIGERMISPSQLISAIEPTLVASSIIPESTDLCKPGGRGYINAINAFTGGSLKNVFFDISGTDGKFDTADMLDGKYVGSVDLGIGMPGSGVLVGNKFIVGGSDPKKLGELPLNVGTKTTGRVSWREIRLQ